MAPRKGSGAAAQGYHNSRLGKDGRSFLHILCFFWLGPFIARSFISTPIRYCKPETWMSREWRARERKSNAKEMFNARRQCTVIARSLLPACRDRRRKFFVRRDSEAQIRGIFHSDFYCTTPVSIPLPCLPPSGSMCVPRLTVGRRGRGTRYAPVFNSFAICDMETLPTSGGRSSSVDA